MQSTKKQDAIKKIKIINKSYVIVYYVKKTYRSFLFEISAAYWHILILKTVFKLFFLIWWLILEQKMEKLNITKILLLSIKNFTDNPQCHSNHIIR